MSALIETPSDVRAAYQRLLEAEQAEVARLTTEVETLRRSLTATRAELAAVREQLAEYDGTAQEDREHDARSAEVEAVDAELPGRRGYEVVP